MNDGRSPECRTFKGERRRPEEYRESGSDRPPVSLDEPATHAYTCVAGNAMLFVDGICRAATRAFPAKGYD
jgi:hypothetical protein